MWLDYLNENIKLLARQALQNNDYKSALDYYRTAAENGNDAESHFNMGIMYATGRGVERDLISAALCFKKADESGYTDANKYLLKVTWDYFNELPYKTKPIEIFQYATLYENAIHRDDDANHINDILDKIATNYMLKKDYYNAYRYYRAMSEFGNDSMAQFNLGLLFLNGMGVDKSDLAAMYWFDRATTQGNGEARKHRDGILSAYVDNYGVSQTKDELKILIYWCTNGSSLVPQDVENAKFWKRVRKEL